MTDVLIVGAGPVGLMLAALLGKLGKSVLVLEKKSTRDSGSNAIGITPPSQDLLKRLGLADDLALWGATIRHVEVHGENQRTLGCVDFEHPILSVPQGVTEMLLEQRLREFASVNVEYGWEYKSFDQGGDFLMAMFQDAAGNPRAERASFLVGCDGLRSRVRETIGVKYHPKKFGATFLMGDYPDDTGWADDAHLFFTPLGAVESFPLGQGKRRWIVQTPEFLDQPGDYLEEQVLARTGLVVRAEQRTWQSPFGIRRWVSPVYAFGRVYLAGDSAHQMSPIGGQGMNTGFADAEFLAALLVARLGARRDDQAERWNQLYSRIRRRAARVAAARSELSMAMGTVKGGASGLRNALLAWVLRTLKRHIPPHYGMLTIPLRNLAQARAKHPELAPLKDIV